MDTTVKNSFTTGPIVKPLLKFMLPVILDLFLQAMYGAVDLLVVGRFATAADISGVSTGFQVLQTITNVIVSFAMGITVTIGQQLGAKQTEKVNQAIGTGIVLFGILGVILTICMFVFASPIASLLNVPKAAFHQTVGYLRICGLGSLIIIAYNLISSIFRGLGDSKTPLWTVMIACVCNIIGDLILVALLHLGVQSAAIATVIFQLSSVLLSIQIIRKMNLPFEMHLQIHKESLHRIIRVGFPIARQDFLVSLSFIAILMFVNALGVTASAGIGIAEKVCAFIMLIPSAFMQSMSAFVAQNVGAHKIDRANKTLYSGIVLSLVFGILMSFLTFHFRSNMAGIFTTNPMVIKAGADYLEAYAIDCLLTCFLFCFVGFYNGVGQTVFVMVQGIIGAFCVRIPVPYVMSHQRPVSLFHIGLATPCSTIIQIVLCLIVFHHMQTKLKESRT